MDDFEKCELAFDILEYAKDTGRSAARQAAAVPWAARPSRFVLSLAESRIVSVITFLCVL